MGKVGDKGYTGNPGGRPKMPEELKKAFQEASEEARKTLVEVMRNGIKDCDRVKASEVILDRAWGKPVQSVDATVNDGSTIIDTSKLTAEQKTVLAELALTSISDDEPNP